MSTYSSTELPLRIGIASDFARVISALRSAGFDETNVCQTLNVKDMADIEAVKPEDATLENVPAPLSLFVRLFLFMDLMPRGEVETVLDRSTLDSFLALDLLRIGDYGEDHYYTPVFLYPVAGLVIASDRHSSPDGSPYVPPADVVFPAIFTGTLRFLRLLPQSPAEDALDLCSGSGAGALLLSRHAKRSVASDITERAAHFALFNSMLNDCLNTKPVCGDLYGAVEGMTFDRIVAHPPYMPTPRADILWRDGGDTGEYLFRRIVEELPRFLRRGGTAYILSLGLDTEDGRLEERARRWLGASHNEFDVIFGLGSEKTIQELLDGLGRRDNSPGSEDIGLVGKALEREKTIQVVYGALVIHRRAESTVEPWTARVRMTGATEGTDFEWALSWHERRSHTDFLDRLAQEKPRLSPHLEIKVTHVVYEGRLAIAEAVLEVDKPFLFGIKLDGWAVTLIAQFDGNTTPAEIYAAARADSSVPDELSPGAFINLVEMLIEKGCLVLT